MHMAATEWTWQELFKGFPQTPGLRGITGERTHMVWSKPNLWGITLVGGAGIPRYFSASNSSTAKESVATLHCIYVSGLDLYRWRSDSIVTMTFSLPGSKCSPVN